MSPFAQHQSSFLLSWLCPGLAPLVPLRSNSALLALLSLIAAPIYCFLSFLFFFSPHPKPCPSLPALTLCYNEYPLTWSCNTDISGLCSYLVSGQLHPRHRLVISNSSFPNRILHLYLLNSYFPPLFPISANNKIIQKTWMDTLTSF